MAIDPILQAKLFLAAFLGGVLLGVLAECAGILRILLGAHLPPTYMRRLYERPLPLLGRPIGMGARRARRFWCRVVAAVGDLLFPLIAAVLVLVLLFWLNSGVFRIGVPLLALGGFAAWRVLCAARFARVFAWLAFLLAAAWRYLLALACWPPKTLWRVLARFCFLPLGRFVGHLLHAVLRRRPQALCRTQLRIAADGLTHPPKVPRPRAKGRSHKEDKGNEKKLCQKTEKDPQAVSLPSP